MKNKSVSLQGVNEITQHDRELREMKRAIKRINETCTVRVPVPGCPNNTVLYIRPDQDPQEAIDRHLNHKRATIIQMNLAGLESASIHLSPSAEKAIIISVITKKWSS